MEMIKTEIDARYSNNDDEIVTAILFVSFRKESRPRRVDDEDGVYSIATRRHII
jgi:hypothetical protein